MSVRGVGASVLSYISNRAKQVIVVAASVPKIYVACSISMGQHTSQHKNLEVLQA